MTDWLAVGRALADDARRVLVELPTRSEREPIVGTGMGGDETTAIDDAVERGAIARLDELLQDYTLVSEEIGEVVRGGGGPRLVLDPIDGIAEREARRPASSASRSRSPTARR